MARLPRLLRREPALTKEEAELSLERMLARLEGVRTGQMPDFDAEPTPPADGTGVARVPIEVVGVDDVSPLEDATPPADTVDEVSPSAEPDDDATYSDRRLLLLPERVVSVMAAQGDLAPDEPLPLLARIDADGWDRPLPEDVVVEPPAAAPSADATAARDDAVAPLDDDTGPGAFAAAVLPVSTDGSSGDAIAVSAEVSTPPAAVSAPAISGRRRRPAVAQAEPGPADERPNPDVEPGTVAGTSATKRRRRAPADTGHAAGVASSAPAIPPTRPHAAPPQKGTTKKATTKKATTKKGTAEKATTDAASSRRPSRAASRATAAASPAATPAAGPAAPAAVPAPVATRPARKATKPPSNVAVAGATPGPAVAGTPTGAADAVLAPAVRPPSRAMGAAATGAATGGVDIVDAGHAAVPPRPRPRKTAATSAAGRAPRAGTRIPATQPAYCPYCAHLLVPPPTASKRCERCRQRIVVRRVDGRSVFLTEAAVLVFETQRKRGATSGRLVRDRARWLKLAVSVGAPAARIERLERVALTEDTIRTARALYLATAERAYRAAKREHRWEEAATIRYEHAVALFREAGSPVPPPAEITGLQREAALADLRGIAELAKDAMLESAGCCEVCRTDDGLIVRISAELRSARLPHPGCERGLCRCRWDLAQKDRSLVARYLRRRPRS